MFRFYELRKLTKRFMPYNYNTCMVCTFGLKSWAKAALLTLLAICINKNICEQLIKQIQSKINYVFILLKVLLCLATTNQ